MVRKFDRLREIKFANAHDLPPVEGIVNSFADTASACKMLSLLHPYACSVSKLFDDVHDFILALSALFGDQPLVRYDLSPAFKSTQLDDVDDARLSQYSRELSRRISEMVDLELIVEHRFLPLQEEAAMEKDALFSNHINLEIISNLTSQFTRKNELPTQHFIVASIGTSSTQVYSENDVIGAMPIGTSALLESPQQAGRLLQRIIESSAELGIEGPIILMNSIS